MNAGCAGKTVRSLENACRRGVFTTRRYTNSRLPYLYLTCLLASLRRLMIGLDWAWHSVIAWATFGLLAVCRTKLFPESTVRNMSYQVLHGLAFMHEHGELMILVRYTGHRSQCRFMRSYCLWLGQFTGHRSQCGFVRSYCLWLGQVTGHNVGLWGHTACDWVRSQVTVWICEVLLLVIGSGHRSQCWFVRSYCLWLGQVTGHIVGLWGHTACDWVRSQVTVWVHEVILLVIGSVHRSQCVFVRSYCLWLGHFTDQSLEFICWRL